MSLLTLKSLSQRLVLIVMACTLTVLAIASAVMLVKDASDRRAVVLQSLESSAALLAHRSSAAIQFLDPELAERNLVALEQVKDLQRACLYIGEDSLLASYRASETSIRACKPTVGPLGFESQDNGVSYTTAVVLDGETIGYLTLSSSLNRVRDATREDLGLFALTTLLALLVGWWLATRMQRLVSVPILDLARRAQQIRSSEDYSIRAVKQSEDEVGELVDSFNAMLARIEADNESLKRSEARFKVLTSASTIGIFQLNKDGAFSYVNDRWRGMTALWHPVLSLEEFLERVHVEDRAAVAEQFWRCFTYGTDFKTRFRMRTLGDEEIHVICESKAFVGDTQGMEGCIGSLFDVSEQIVTEQMLEHQLLYDGLTDIANRQLFEDRLAQVLRDSDRTGQEAAVVFLDLDDFKRVNESYGHEQGDQVLITIARRLTDCTRLGDTVARIDADAFAVLVSEVISHQSVAVLAEKLREAVMTPITVEGGSVVLSASLGVALSRQRNLDVETFMEHADIAMYKAKAAGRNTFRFYADDLNREYDRHTRIGAELRGAINEQQLSLYVQPIWSAADEGIDRYEALLRWQHPTHGLMLPEEFLTIADDIGVIAIIRDQVLREVCAAINVLKAEGLLADAGWVSINVSAPEFYADDFPGLVEQTLAEAGVEPAHLVLEITEQTLRQNMELALEQLKRLSAQGVRIAVDNFGSGHTSFVELRQFPVDILKIDRLFLEGLDRDPHHAVTVLGVSAFAATLGFEVVAEGVEQFSQARTLAACGIRNYQGYLLSSAVPVTILVQQKAVLTDRVAVLRNSLLSEQETIA